MSAFSFQDRTPDRMPAQAESLPREALVIILQLICRRQADINIGSVAHVTVEVPLLCNRLDATFA